MNATENRLKFEMEDARQTILWCAEQIAHFQEQQNKAQQIHDRAKSELKTLNDKK